MTLSPAQWSIAAAMPEDRGPDSLAAHLQRLMRDLGLTGYHVHDSRRSQPGWPDWVILGARGGLFRELKSERGQLTPEQRSTGARLICARLDWAVWRPRDLLDGTIAAQLQAIARLERAA